MSDTHLAQFSLQRCHLFRVGEGDVQTRRDGVDELNTMLLSSGDESHQLI